MSQTSQNVGVDAEIPPSGSPVSLTVTFFQRHWKRGAPGRPTPEWVLHFTFRVWLVALLLKLVGSSWDMSWHFRWLRDDLAPPHLINTVGTGMVCVLVLIHTYTGMGCDRRSLRLMQVGVGLFLVAAPLDVINHRISGLDLTAWSPTHALLYLGTGVILLGAIDAWSKFAPQGKARAFTLAGLWIFFLENAYFANGQQEYGILALRSWERGAPGAEPELLQFAADQLRHGIDREAVIHFALPIQDWVYPAWGIGVMALLLLLARRSLRLRWAATAVASGYVAYRAVIWPLLVVAEFPPSTVPFYLVLVGVAVDVAVLLAGTRQVTLAGLAAALVTALGFGALWLQSQLAGWLMPSARTESAPDVDYLTIPAVLVGVAVAIAAAGLVGRWWALRTGSARLQMVPDALV